MWAFSFAIHRTHKSISLLNMEGLLESPGATSSKHDVAGSLRRLYGMLWFLQVNHSPSFHTDTQIDCDIKESLLKDTFIILNLTQADKKKVIEEDRRRVRERLLHGINCKMWVLCCIFQLKLHTSSLRRVWWCWNRRCLCLMNRMQDKIAIVNKTTVETVVKFKYLGRKLTNQNCAHEGMKSRLNSRNSHYHSSHNFSSSCSLADNEMIEIYRTIILTVSCRGV